MVKFVLLFPRKKGLSRDEFMHLWRDVCVPMVRQLPGLRRLVISPVIEQPVAAEPRYDGIAERWFDDAAAGKPDPAQGGGLLAEAGPAGWHRV